MKMGEGRGNVVLVLGIDRNIFESRSYIFFKRVTLLHKLVREMYPSVYKII